MQGLYKVGDWVKIRDDMQVNTDYGCLTYLDGMNKYAGTYHKIAALENNGALIRLTGCAFFWSDAMLIPRTVNLRGGDTIRFSDNPADWSSMPDGVRDQYMGKVATIRDDGWAVEDFFQIDGDEYYFSVTLVADKLITRQRFESAAANAADIKELRKILWS